MKNQYTESVNNFNPDLANFVSSRLTTATSKYAMDDAVPCSTCDHKGICKHEDSITQSYCIMRDAVTEIVGDVINGISLTCKHYRPVHSPLNYRYGEIVY